MEAFYDVFSNKHHLSGVFYLAAGSVLSIGGGVWAFILANRPRLVIEGSSSGGNQTAWSCGLRFVNYPSLLGLRFQGESACRLRAGLRLAKPGSMYSRVAWKGHNFYDDVTLGPGEAGSLELFQWTKGCADYFIVDGNNQPAQRFHERKLRFTLQIYDNLGRPSNFPLLVTFEAPTLNRMPTLSIRYPLPATIRLARLKMGLGTIVAAFMRPLPLQGRLVQMKSGWWSIRAAFRRL